MQTDLAPRYRGTPDGEEAEAVLRKCVHCGFCTATCPTYQLLGDELDGPRGRIYLIKQVLEGQPATRSTQLHLDRCLTCRNCESTCPSGVQYGRLVEVGRAAVAEQVTRSPLDRAQRWLLKEGLPSPLFAPALKLGQALRPLLPQRLKDKVPPKPAPDLRGWPTRSHERRVLLLQGCVQPALAPNINAATARALDAAGVQTLVAAEAGCCGAIRSHLDDREGGREHMRRNIDAWWPLLQDGRVEAVVANASGCSVMLKDYGHALRDDAAYAAKAERIAGLSRDLSELLPTLLSGWQERLQTPSAETAPGPRIVFHPPCTLQHGQQLRGGIEEGLRALGFDVSLAAAEAHLCCGSAGTYSVLHPELATALRERKLQQLEATQPQVIASANIGCLQHLQAGTTTAVRHWIELVDDRLASAGAYSA
ncbi:glycolate oxidase subunit GlcF [Aquabacterium sp. J223]|uniref:glycolate oxidase subunit GlcF n=1 Tax=Aquabacterium sp. J223 TaxID=2898431 RepID=UPI0021ADA241|nr:glycolate oxidase subunit GlcF [Aquabacterium sp. J223]UUX96290.1 glycolate oxidase subunit GlcF [Aquabacterium sp. J223]